MGEEIAGLSSNLFVFSKSDLDENGQIDPMDVQCANVVTGKIATIHSTLVCDDGERKPWAHNFNLSGTIEMSKEQVDEMRRVFPPEMFRRQIISAPLQDNRPRSFTITSQEEELSPEEQTAQAYEVYLKDRGGKSYHMKHCKIERKKREYRHSNPSKYNKRKKRIKRNTL